MDSALLPHLRETDLPINTHTAAEDRPIGVFDSGIGGLTVVNALRNELPCENIFYLGDTARVPYGGKSPQTVERYSIEISGLLLAEQAKIIVVACNTASALAVPRLQQILKVPVVGVLLPGAQVAASATRNGHIGVIGTRATIYSGAYERAIRSIAPEARVTSQACPLLVPLIEEAWLEDALTDQVIMRYLEPMVQQGIDTLVLGCTHYPLLRPAFTRLLGDAVQLVDSAQACAKAVHQLLQQQGMTAEPTRSGRLQVALTDSSEGFLKVAQDALGLQVGDVQLRMVQPYAGAR